ncbi:NUDIX hydrolase [Paenibacillus thermotolerans]|uniref:NUDIX hydrolase n=1 Tax=Paenibacillus thermotolerans TaxID=3027807 RepID=UPI002367BC1B|nr:MULTISPECIES: NUDIX domain-containing protein [unclassified Paenibacillus]
MKEEIFDIFDPEMNKIGKASRSDVHRNGLWHQTFQCWIWSREPRGNGVSLLFQLRHEDKDTYPNLLDISCAGHLQAGETVEDGTRELQEELGLDVAFSDLVSCGVYKQEAYISEQLIDREFCHVFLLENKMELTSYRLQKEEVKGLFRIAAADVKRLLNSGGEIVCDGVVLDSEDRFIGERRNVGIQDFVPHPAEYFHRLFQRLVEVGA